jgi:thiol:disulfide interchange protein
MWGGGVLPGGMLRWLLLPILIATASAQTFQGKTLVRPSLVADTTAIVPGRSFQVGLLLEMAPGWHTYWQYGGDSGFPTTLSWTLTAGLTAGPLEWPLPKRIPEPGDIEVYAYKDKVLLLTTLQAAADLAPGTVTLRAAANWLVCEAICVPGSAKLELTLPFAGSAEPANEELFAQFRAALPSEKPPPFTLTWKSGTAATELTVSGLGSATAVDVFPLPAEGQQVGHPQSTPITNGTATVTIPTTGPVRGVLVVETPEGRQGWVVQSGDERPATPDASAPTATGPAQRPVVSLWTALLAGLLGGVILNVMPCVLPVISLKIFGFVRQAGSQPERVFRHGLAFVAGIFVFFLGLGLLIALINERGGSAGWGSQFQNPWFNVAMCSLIFLFALNLFGVFEIVLPGRAATALEAAGSHGGYAGSFFQGAFSTLLATSCSAPFLGTALGFTVGRPPAVVMLIFAAIAAGMSAPYLLLSANPGWMKILPKPGMWMERVKQFMGFPLLAAMLWLMGVVGKQKGTDGVIWLAAFLLCLGLAAWIYGAFCGPTAKRTARWTALALAVAISVAAGGFFLGRQFAGATRSPAAPSPADGIAWREFSPQALAQLRAEGTPVFLDFTADWCLNCKYYEKTAINMPAVRKAFTRLGVVPMKADWTSPNDDIKDALNSFGRDAIPFYVLYPANGAEPIVLGDFLTQQILLDALKAVR